MTNLGPLSVTRLNEWQFAVGRDTEEGGLVAIIDDSLPDDDAEDYARLFAAAPDLYEACRRAIPWLGKLIADGAHLNSVAPNDAIGALEQLEAAVAKAEPQ